MLIVGRETLVTIRVDSVTSTWERSSLGDGRTYSAPMAVVSSGGLPGQRSRTRGSAAGAGEVRHTSARAPKNVGRRMSVGLANGCDWNQGDAGGDGASRTCRQRRGTPR